MLVSCPECGTKISSEANPCPKCGFHEAGIRSLEYNQKCLEYYEREAGVVKYPRPLKCSMCGYIGTDWTRKGYGLIEKGTGYDYTSGDVYCPRCGESTDKGEWVDVLEEKQRREQEMDRWNRLYQRKKNIKRLVWFFLFLALFLIFLLPAIRK